MGREKPTCRVLHRQRQRVQGEIGEGEAVPFGWSTDRAPVGDEWETVCGGSLGCVTEALSTSKGVCFGVRRHRVQGWL